jgi:pimeloyl-ACP methyl ester carboxylesterase
VFYTATADPNVVEADTKAAVNTPSGEILTIGMQPSRFVVGNIKVPVFLQFSDGDRLFEPEYADMHKGEFRSASSVTVDMVKDAGHTFMLTKNGRTGADHMVEWLRSRPETPSCR